MSLNNDVYMKRQALFEAIELSSLLSNSERMNWNEDCRTFIKYLTWFTKEIILAYNSGPEVNINMTFINPDEFTG